ncbi:NAD(P)/FAD-dependent oxidoreductase [Chloroflexota bacterium]
MAKTAKTKYLIVGNSAGGIGAAEAIREVDREGAITIVSDEPYPAYSRPLISEYLTGECLLERMLFRPADFYEKNHITALFDRKVKGLDLARRSVWLDDGERILWEKLLLATGGAPVVPPIKGRDRDGVFTFTTLDDARAIKEFLGGVRRAVVIGGGLIGISVTEALIECGVAVSVVEMKERVLNTILDEEASVLTEEALKRAGVEVLTGHTVAAILGAPSGLGPVSGVDLDDGRRLPCQMVVVAIGVVPRIELASASGVKVNRGITVDRHMATSCSDVYSCGDAAEAYDFLYDSNRPIPIWPGAYLGGRVAGRNMAGVLTEYAGVTAMNSLKYFGLDIVSAGMVAPPEGDGYEVLTRREDSSYQKVVLKDGFIVGMTFVGKIEKSGIIFGLMKDHVDVREFKESLLADDFGLASLPQEIWRHRFGIPSGAGLGKKLLRSVDYEGSQTGKQYI